MRGCFTCGSTSGCCCPTRGPTGPTGAGFSNAVDLGAKYFSGSVGPADESLGGTTYLADGGIHTPQEALFVEVAYPVDVARIFQRLTVFLYDVPDGTAIFYVTKDEVPTAL